jgi:hypothetical protein
MDFYVQKFEDGKKGDTTCYAKMTAHNHKRSNQFSKDMINWLVKKGWKRAEIRSGKFMSSQGKPNSGKEFKWSDAENLWIKA